MEPASHADAVRLKNLLAEGPAASMEELSPFTRDCEVLLVVPPFAEIDKPSLGVHLLQACCREQGIRLRILYANLAWAKWMGGPQYHSYCRLGPSDFAGERCFARAAFGHTSGFPRSLPEAAAGSPARRDDPTTEKEEDRLAHAAVEWSRALAALIARAAPPIVGCTTMFQQTAASLSILHELKLLLPLTCTILGGANCQGPMAQGLASIAHGVDHIFSGESEQTLPAFVIGRRNGASQFPRIIEGSLQRALDALPSPDFADFFQQHHAVFHEAPTPLWITYESSRGCWWGEKRHCTFCGLNGESMAFRQKKPERVVRDLLALSARHGTKNVCMVDNIMPSGYFKTLVPELRDQQADLHIFYEQKANLSLEKVLALQEAGIDIIQPGIEALHDDLLRHMRKGVTAGQNIALLRYSRCADLAVNWNLLFGFPGDKIAWYAETAALLPLLHHLPPPAGFFKLSIDRFSPYFERPQDYGISNVRPSATYASLFPEGAPVDAIAYHFEADFQSDSLAGHEVIDEIHRRVAEWREKWKEGQISPVLSIMPIDAAHFMLVDTRVAVAAPACEIISVAQAAVALWGPGPGGAHADLPWALSRSLLYQHQNGFIPLAVAPAALLERLSPARQNAHASNEARTYPHPHENGTLDLAGR